MRIHPLASSSRGNCYLLQEGESCLMIECGIPLREMRRRVQDWPKTFTSLAGCLVSHEHGDHSKAAKDLLARGVRVYTSMGTAGALGIKHTPGIQILQDQVPTVIQPRGDLHSWLVQSFLVKHDAAEPMGFLIGRRGNVVLFLTDTAYSPYRFPGVTHMLVECNYTTEQLDRNIDEGRVHASMRRRLLHSHFSLENLLAFLKANDLSSLKEVWLLHLSDGNSDEREMKLAVQRATGVPVHVCAA